MINKTKLIHKILLIVLSLSILLSCNTNNVKNEEEDFFVIEYSDFSNIDTNKVVMVEYYLDYNIILFDSISDIYYYKTRWLCLTGMGFNGNLPYFRFLQPDDFEKDDDLDKIKEFVFAGMLSDSTKTSRNWVGLIYNQDTIRDKRYFELKQFFMDNNINVATRKTTEEEDVILKSIMSGKKYEPHLIEWKNTFDVPDDFTIFEDFPYHNKKQKRKKCGK